MPDSADQMNRTYPTGHQAGKSSLLPLLPSRIPAPNRREIQQPQDHGRQETKLPPINDRRTSFQYGKFAPPPNGKRRDTSAKYKIRLAEKDQRILETQEYIQVR